MRKRIKTLLILLITISIIFNACSKEDQKALLEKIIKNNNYYSFSLKQLKYIQNNELYPT